MGNNQWRFTEFTVTPAIAHAVALLRAAIPAGAAKIDVELSPERGFTERHKAAASMLVGSVAYHHEHMVGLYGEIDEHTNKAQKARHLAARAALARDIRRKLNIEVVGYYYDGLEGMVTVYR